MAPVLPSLLQASNTTIALARTISQLQHREQTENATTISTECSCDGPPALSNGAIAGICVASAFAFMFFYGACSAWQEEKTKRARLKFQANAAEKNLDKNKKGNDMNPEKGSSSSTSEASATTTTAALNPPATESSPPPTDATHDGKIEQACVNAPVTGIQDMDDLVERQKKLQVRRDRLLELERLDREEEYFLEHMRRGGGHNAVKQPSS